MLPIQKQTCGMSICYQTSVCAFKEHTPTPAPPKLVPVSLCSQSKAGQLLFIFSVKFPQDNDAHRSKRKAARSAASSLCRSLSVYAASEMARETETPMQWDKGKQLSAKGNHTFEKEKNSINNNTMALGIKFKFF